MARVHTMVASVTDWGWLLAELPAPWWAPSDPGGRLAWCGVWVWVGVERVMW